MIQGTPKRSVTMPKPFAQKTCWNGINAAVCAKRREDAFRLVQIIERKCDLEPLRRNAGIRKGIGTK